MRGVCLLAYFLRTSVKLWALLMRRSHIELDPQHHSHLFFWHFQNRHIANRQRTVIWLNGGPGCSSEDGALMEVGPYRVKSGGNDPKLVYNEGSWNEFANLMFVDNPVGTGYSVIDSDSYVTDLPQMADQFVQFLEKWFTIFPEYEDDDASIVGPSTPTWLICSRSISPVNHMLGSTYHTSRRPCSSATRRARHTNGSSKAC